MGSVLTIVGSDGQNRRIAVETFGGNGIRHGSFFGLGAVIALLGVAAMSSPPVALAQRASTCITGGAVANNANSGLASDCEALLEARDALAGSGSLNWSESAPIAEWDGITLRGRPARVGWLDLRAKGLDGSIPSELGSLSNLTYLNLRTNDLSGPIPASLGTLTNLIVLNLNGNDLTGSIPSELGNLTSLREMWLHANDLTGPIPESLGNLANLEKMKLRNNRLSGPIPGSLGNLDSLEWLVVHNNELSGPIPPELGDMDSLEILWLGGNKLSGSIPPQLGRLSTLTQLHLRTNELTGSIPSELKDLTGLKRLWVHQNQLSGSIPSELGDLASLEILNLRANILSGSIPAELGNLSKLKDLFLHDNRLGGAIPDELGDLSNLRRVWLSQNQLTGSIPASLGRLPVLTQLNLHTNLLSGAIPPALGDLADTLTRLRLSGNGFTGCVPAQLRDVKDNDLDDLGLQDCERDDSLAPTVEPCSQLQEVCRQRDVSNPALSGLARRLAWPHSGRPVEETLASSAHIAVRGATAADSVRCEWHGVARTLQERERSLRSWWRIDDDEPLPPPAEFEILSVFLKDLARGGLSNENPILACYADYHIHEYLLGTGPAVVTVAYDSLAFSWRASLLGLSQEQGQDDEERTKLLQEAALDMATDIVALIGNRESVVMLAPVGAQGNIAVEAWQVLAQWDLQFADDGSIEAAQYATPRDDPESRQPLDELGGRIAMAVAADALVDMRIESTEGLRGYYERIGAYEVIGPYNIPLGKRTPFTPSPPPPPGERSIETRPVPMSYSAPSFIAISSGGSLTCGLEADGAAVCWGGETYERTSPSKEEEFSALSSGRSHACGLRPDGSIGCWGDDYRGQSSPPYGSFTMVSSGWDYACALREDGTAECWGQNNSGQSSPPPGVEFKSISAGGAHTCALRTDGLPECWGYPAEGRSTPPEDTRLTSVSSGWSHTCGLRSDGAPVCWGGNLHGQAVAPIVID